MSVAGHIAGAHDTVQRVTRTSAPDAAQPLAGVRVVEISSFVAVPLAGMTLAQLGAEVIRVDPIGGAADYRRWPVTDDGTSIYWAGLNKGKRSVAANMRTSEGQNLVQRLILDAGVLVTNVAGRQWHSYETLVQQRPDLIHLEVPGRADGSTGVDYTVNAATGFPLITGPVDHGAPINHVLPAWDVACGLYAALAVAAALRHRDATGEGSQIRLPLENVALAIAGNLGFLTEAMVTGTQRERLGNSIYGQYGQDFTSSDGVSFMVVALTGRHFRDLAEVTRTTKAVAALSEALGADFTDEGERYRNRDALTGLFTVWFREHSAEQITAALSSTSILWERYRSFLELAGDQRVTANPMFTRLLQPRIGEHLAAGLPMSIDGTHPPAVAAPAVGDDTVAVLRERLGMSPDEIDRLTESGTVATTSADE
jgi:2-methylfumaryl-CoA isomerase